MSSFCGLAGKPIVFLVAGKPCLVYLASQGLEAEKPGGPEEEGMKKKVWLRSQTARAFGWHQLKLLFVFLVP